MGKFSERLAERMRRRDRLRREDVTDLVQPEWAEVLGGDRLYLREPTAAERDDYETSRISTRFLPNGKTEQALNLRNIRARLVAPLLVDEDSQQVLGDGGATLLADESGALLDRLFTVAQRLGGFSAAADEELEKNLHPASQGGSPSSSPCTPAANGSPTLTASST